ncbi:MerR family transcriptional regulator [Marinactinospora thermotolerans]|uniref:MerR family transcriptional regulator n=1 Tax=Marinactinospora thermotolerans TaxID=531310 RepID=UPI00099ADCC4
MTASARAQPARGPHTVGRDTTPRTLREGPRAAALTDRLRGGRLPGTVQIGAVDRGRAEPDARTGRLRDGAQRVRVRRRGIGDGRGLAGVRTSALRLWEKREPLAPHRERSTGYRRYDEAEPLKARGVALLRRARSPSPPCERCRGTARHGRSRSGPRRTRRTGTGTAPPGSAAATRPGRPGRLRRAPRLGNGRRARPRVRPIGSRIGAGTRTRPPRVAGQPAGGRRRPR